MLFCLEAINVNRSGFFASFLPLYWKNNSQSILLITEVMTDTPSNLIYFNVLSFVPSVRTGRREIINCSR